MLAVAPLEEGAKMTFAKGSALVLALAGAVALGVWMGPYIRARGAAIADKTASVAHEAGANDDKGQTARNDQRASTTQQIRAKHSKVVAVPAAPVATMGTLPTTMPAAAPALHERLKPVLNKGADMGIAAEGFDSAEQFAVVAHAARNTKVPFMVLKHRVVNEGMSLEDAIRELKPELNAAAEVQRARVEAKSDISDLEG